MAEWLVEEGIGEHRAALVADGAIIAARVEWPGRLAAGAVIDATLVHRAAGSPRGTARAGSGEELLVDGLPRDAREGAPLRVAVTRAAIAEKGRLKRAQARPSEAAPAAAPQLVDRLAKTDTPARIVRRFPAIGWDELAAEARDGVIAFAGGAICIALTPAMTLIDVDGELAPRTLALAAVPAIAAAVRRLDLGGAIGVDFPSLADKADRRAVDQALATALAGWPHERTAMNGFGFVQLVARLERPSLMHLAQRDPAGAAARSLLRQAEGIGDPGELLLTAHPAVLAALATGWLDELARRSGRAVRLQGDPALAPDGGFAQAISA